MKLLILCTVIFHSLFSFTYTLKPKKVNSDIYCFIGAPEVMDIHNNGNMVNSCFVDLGKSYLVVDSGPSYNYARDAHKAMKRIKNQKVSHVINTHAHDDHWLGNGYYKEQKATIYGAKIFANRTKSEQIRMQKHILPQAFAGTTEVFPVQFIDGAQELEMSGVKIVLHAYDKKIHSAGDMVVHIPSKNVLFAGDLLFNERVLSLRDGDINNWLKALAEIESYQTKYIIGGHGAEVTRDSLKVTRAYLQAMKSKILAIIERGVDLNDAMREAEMPEFAYLKLYDKMHRANFESAFRTLEWGEEQ